MNLALKLTFISNKEFLPGEWAPVLAHFEINLDFKRPFKFFTSE